MKEDSILNRSLTFNINEANLILNVLFEKLYQLNTKNVQTLDDINRIKMLDRLILKFENLINKIQ